MTDKIISFEEHVGAKLQSGEQPQFNDDMKNESGKEKVSSGRKRRIDKTKIIIIAIVILIAAVLIFLSGSRLRSYSFKDEIETETNTDVKYSPFADGYIKYSTNGVEYQEELGKDIWNYAIPFSRPYLIQATDYVLIFDRGKNKIALFNENGKVRDHTLKAPVCWADVSNNGRIVVAMDGDDAKYIQVFDEDGRMIADMKASVDYYGYPLTVAMSPTGYNVAASYVSVSGKNVSSRIEFYDLNPEEKSENVDVQGSIDTENTLIPVIKYIDDYRVAAVGDKISAVYDTEDAVNEEKSFEFEEPIKSVLFDKDGVIYITENQTVRDSEGNPDGNSGFYYMSKDGDVKIHKTVDLDYEEIELIGEEIIARKGNIVSILTVDGKIKFSDAVEGEGLKQFIPSGEHNSYFAVYNDKVRKIRLSILP